MNPDIGMVNLEEALKDFPKDSKYSESDTRCKVIDRILLNSLGWKENQIRREESNVSGFADYVLSINGIPQIIIEAKKAGVWFEIPKAYGHRRYKISGSISGVPFLTDAISQVRNYCINLGVRFAAVTNGYQFFLFPAFSPGRKWEETEGLVFHSTDDLLKNFGLFWNILSSESVAEGALVEYLDKGKLELNFQKIISDIHNPDQKWARNRLYTYLRPICEFVFSELIDEAKTEVLQQCYVFERSNRNLGDELSEVFVDKMPHFASNFNIRDIFERENKAGVFQKEFERFQSDPKESTLLLLLGGIGSGKSTFLHRFFKVVMREKTSLMWFYLDFRSSSFDETKIEHFVYDTLVKDYFDRYSNVTETILKEIGFSTSRDNPKQFIQHLFKLLKLLKRSIVIVIDNVDQHDFSFQEKLFILSNHLTKELNSLVILAIREETFLQSTQTGVFDAYHIPKFHISSPNFINMIKRRIIYSKEWVKDDPIIDSRVAGDASLKNELIHFFEILDRSLFKDNPQSKNIVKFFDNISVGNMRESLLMFNNFLISGNTNIDEMFQKEKTDGNTFQIAFHQLLKSIMLGENRYYSSERSHIGNLFDFDTSLGDSHFNQLRVLRILEDKANVKSRLGRGYFEIEELLSLFSAVSIDRKIIHDSLNRLALYNLVYFDNQSKTGLNSASFAKISPAGRFYLNELIYQIGYLDAVSVDTPISSRETYQNIRKLINNDDLQARVLKTKYFVEYLIESERLDLNNNPSLIHDKSINFTFTEGIKQAFNQMVDYFSKKKFIENPEREKID